MADTVFPDVGCRSFLEVLVHIDQYDYKMTISHHFSTGFVVITQHEKLKMSWDFIYYMDMLFKGSVKNLRNSLTNLCQPTAINCQVGLPFHLISRYAGANHVYVAM